MSLLVFTEQIDRDSMFEDIVSSPEALGKVLNDPNFTWVELMEPKPVEKPCCSPVLQ